ncbi:nuclease-related domain-containing DEAD/DEAH box helicase [Metabacillus litoralis]|uniref:nuclease-related domain-containing DEAD/DEAH box helicase n=1 Tax=Metabacillus litoralis TaxID=152268 RepID=UPI000EF59067|nr:nuclease-related domain-containing DEAD/DEAH box helicase [Metabacillus litoralis]
MSAEIFESYNPNDPRTKGEQYLLDVFRNSSRFDGWMVFEQPHINSMKPDFVLLHPSRGIIIIEVKDWNLTSSVYENGGYIRGTDGRSHKKNPINQVENYKKSILKSELTNSVYLAEEFEKNYYACIETVVYFHGAAKANALAFCNNNLLYTKIWTKEDIEYIKNTHNPLNNRIHTYALSRQQSAFNHNGQLEELVKELAKHLQYADYNFERRRPFILTPSQSELSELSPGSIRRWSGVAGAGKSLILAEKAVKALRDNKRVLILTFNITLRHYLRDLVSQQFGQGNYEGERKKLRKDLTIIHFHELLKIIMTEHEIEVDFDDEDQNFTQRWMSLINIYFLENNMKDQFNYDYILVDEGQDFMGEWIRFLKQFYTKKGELFIVYDKAQDLFNHGVWIEDADQVKNIGFKGRPGNLKYTHRLPDTMVQKIRQVREVLQIQGEDILVAREEQLSFLQTTFWLNCKANNISDKLSQLTDRVKELRKSNDWEDITIITTNEKTGAELVEYFERYGVKTSHVYDLQRQSDQKRRKSEKWKFQGGTGRLKICSFHSYKGWQTPNIILVLDSPTTQYIDGNVFVTSVPNSDTIKNALFISMSRVKGKETTGEFSFTCLNYLPQYDHLKSSF